MTSPIRTAPVAHSPPNPSPCNPRRMNSCSKFCAKLHRKVKTEYHRIAICSTRTRPMQSASAPANQPPNNEVTTGTVPMVRGSTGRHAPDRNDRGHDAGVELLIEAVQCPAAPAGEHGAAFL